MAVNEQSRRLLYDRLEEVLGVGQGDVLMEYLPPMGWADVATRRDVEESVTAVRHELGALDQRLSHRLDRLEADLAHRFDRIDGRFEAAEAVVAHRFEAAEAGVAHRFEAAEAGVAHRFDRVDARFDSIDDRLARLTAEMTAAFRGEITAAMTLQTRQTIFAIVGVLLAVAALVAAVLGLG